MLHPCFWLSHYPMSTSSPADSHTLGVVIVCFDCLASLCRVFLDQNMNPGSGVAEGFVLCGGSDYPQSARASPVKAGRAAEECRVVSALVVLQEKAGDDTSLGTDQKPNGKPADVQLVSQHPTQPFFTTSNNISVLILTLCCLLITTGWTFLFHLYFIACNSKLSLLLPAIFFPHRRRV